MDSNKMSGAELVVKALKALKVKYIFGYPGGSVLDIYDALFAENELDHILVRHEQAATHMADGFARAVFQEDVYLARADDGDFELGDLVALGQVGIEVVFAGEDGAAVDLGVGGQAEFHRHGHNPLVQHRQHSR